MYRVIDGAGWRSEVKETVHSTAVKWFADIELAKFKTTLAAEVVEIVDPPGEHVVNGDYRISVGQEGIAQVRTKETRASGHQYALWTHALLWCLPRPFTTAA
jgi:hypothetical protein